MEQKLYYTISQVADMLQVNPSVLRFWETEFPTLHPTKNRRGVRLYTQRDIELLKRIHHLTRQCGYTLDGAREQLRSSNPSNLSNPSPSLKKQLLQLKEQLIELSNQL